MTDLGADQVSNESGETRPAVSRDRARAKRGRREHTPPIETVAPAGQRPVSKARVWPFLVVTLAVVVAMVGLTRFGYQRVQDLKGGASAASVTDPTKANYEVKVAPTPTYLVVLVDSDGSIGDLMLVSKTADRGGSILYIPGQLVVRVDDKAFNLAELTKSKGIAATRDAVTQFLGLGVTATLQVNTQQLTTLFSTASDLTFENADAILNDSKETVYESGDLSLTPAEVAKFVFAHSPGEAATSRSARLQTVMAAWFGSLTETTQTELEPVVPVEGGAAVDVGALLVGVATGTPREDQLPVVRNEVPGLGIAVYEADTDAIAALIPDLVPFPQSAFDGQRVQVKVLNGTKATGVLSKLAASIVAANGEIIVAGNASSFDVASTTVTYHGKGQQEAAQKIADRLGFGTVVAGSETDSVDVTITVGADFTG